MSSKTVFPFDQIVVWGLGVMGSSLGYRVKKNSPKVKVTGVVRRKEVIPTLIEKEIVDVAYTSIIEAIESSPSGLIVLSTPIETIKSQIKELSEIDLKRWMITDIGSVKSSIVNCSHKFLRGRSGVFVGSHPMTGTEKYGHENFLSDLYQNAPCIVSPHKDNSTNRDNIDRVKSFWKGVGCQIYEMDPELHDFSINWVSHVPHAISFVLFQSLLKQQKEFEGIFQLGAGSFRDMTRIAGSSPQIWTDIFQNNTKELIKGLSFIQDELESFKKVLQKRDKSKLYKYLESISEAKQKLD